MKIRGCYNTPCLLLVMVIGDDDDDHNDNVNEDPWVL